MFSKICLKSVFIISTMPLFLTACGSKESDGGSDSSNVSNILKQIIPKNSEDSLHIINPDDPSTYPTDPNDPNGINKISFKTKSCKPQIHTNTNCVRYEQPTASNMRVIWSVPSNVTHVTIHGCSGANGGAGAGGDGGAGGVVTITNSNPIAFGSYHSGNGGLSGIVNGIGTAAQGGTGTAKAFTPPPPTPSGGGGEICSHDGLGICIPSTIGGLTFTLPSITPLNTTQTAEDGRNGEDGGFGGQTQFGEVKMPLAGPNNVSSLKYCAGGENGNQSQNKTASYDLTNMFSTGGFGGSLPNDNITSPYNSVIQTISNITVNPGDNIYLIIGAGGKGGKGGLSGKPLGKFRQMSDNWTTEYDRPKINGQDGTPGNNGYIEIEWNDSPISSTTNP